MLTYDEVNALCREVAQEAQEKFIGEQLDLFTEDEEQQANEELSRQYEMMSYAAELENFSPFDTVNS
jgi:hypothetical protein